MSTAMFIITSNNRTPQSHRSHSCLHLLWRRNNGGLMTAHSGWVKGKIPVSIIDCKKDGQRVSTSFHYRKVKPKHSQYGCCHLAKITSFGARVYTVVIVRWSRGIKVPPKLPQTQSQAHNHDTIPHFYSIK